MSKLLRFVIALFLMSVVFFIAALQIPHIGEGAPDWHTVKRPQIPLQSINDDCNPPPLPAGDGDALCSKEHPPIALVVGAQVCISEPFEYWKYDCESKTWVKARGTHAVSKYVRKTVTAFWIDTIHCYAFYDDYGRLKAVPDFK
ncbi:MAG: hypothetical protein K2X81_24150 [Candidatus Obscuribacterales bacterium]|nr:hypothetical protein [Candidatus Obscuribacterales bacterium]